MKKNEEALKPEIWSLCFYRASGGLDQAPTAKRGQKTIRCESAGADPIDTIIRAIGCLTKTSGKIIYFSLQPASRDGSLHYEASMSVSFLGRDAVLGQSAGANIIEVSARAFLDAVNQHLSDPNPGIEKRESNTAV